MDSTTGHSGDADWSSRHLWQLTPVQDVFWIGLAVTLVWFGYYLRGLFVPVLIGIGLAYIMNPVLSLAEQRWKLPRPLTIGLILGGLTAITLVTLAFVVPVLISEVQTLSRKAPSYAAALSQRLNTSADDEVVARLKQLSGDLPANGLQLAESALSNTGTAMGFFSDIIATSVYVVGSLCLIPVYFFFFAWHFNPMLARLQQLIPTAHRERVLHVSRRMDNAVGNFLRGRLLVVLVMMVMFSGGFWVAGVPYWFLLGSLTGLLSFVPYLAVAGCILAMGVKWIDLSTGSGGAFDWTSVVVWPAAAYGVVQLLEGWLLTPWIQSKSMEMSAVVILIVVLIGGAVAGLYGLLLAIPAAGCARILCEEFLLPKLESWAEDA